MKATAITPRSASWVLIAGVALVFGQAVFFGFITFDDGAYVFMNRSVIRGISGESVISAFTAEVAGNWHPFTMLAHMTVSSLVGPNPWAYHLLNVALHIVNSVLFFQLLRALLIRSRQPLGNCGIRENQPSSDIDRLITASCWFAAGVFALHPLRVESVVWISELKDLLSALFFLSAIRAYLEWVDNPIRKNYLLLVVWFAAGLMAKPMLVTLPCVLLLLDYWPLGRLGSVLDVRRLGSLLLEKAPLFLLSAALCVVTFHYQKMGHAVQTLESFPVELRVQSAVLAYAGYLGKTLWPVDLAVFYPYPKQWPVYEVAGASVLMLLLTISAVLAIRRFPAWFTGWFWYVGTLVPVIGLVQVGKQCMADRYTYIPSMGISLVIAWAVTSLLERRIGSLLWSRSLAIVSIAILTSLSILTRQQTALWRNGETLYRHALRVTGENWFMRQSLAVILGHTGRLDEGIEHLREALRIDPDNAGIWDDLGYLLQLKGKIPEAVHSLEEAIRLDPRRSGAHRILASIFRQTGETARAIEHLRQAIQIAPGDEQALLELARIRASHPDAAIRDAAEAVRLARNACESSGYQNPDALDILAAAYAENQQFDLALDFARRGAQAAESSGKSTLAAQIRKRISLYEMRIPFRDLR